MGLRINTNVQSIASQMELSRNRQKLDHSNRKLASGSRIVQAKDDAAGLGISEKLRADIVSTNQNIKNAQNGMLLLETAEGGLNQITNIVIRMKELSIQASNDSNGPKERAYLDNEYQQLKAELERISQTTTFNGRELLNGMGGTFTIQVGPNNDPMRDRIDVTMDYVTTLEGLELEELSVSTSEQARMALDPLTEALDKIASVRASIGASESRLGSTISNLMEYEVNLSSGFSTIRDADLAKETAEATKYNILTQAGISVLLQANSNPQLALKLLG